MIHMDRLAVTLFWDGRRRIPYEINIKNICRSYRTGKCPSGFKCKKLHICKEFKLSTHCALVDAGGTMDDHAIIDTDMDLDTDDFVDCIIKSLSIPRKASPMPHNDMHFIQSS